MKFFKTSVLTLGLLFFAGSVFAQGQKMQKPAQQDSITNKELKKFVNVYSEAQKINQESQMKVQSMLKEKDMEMKRFQKIMMSKQNPKMADSITVTEKEKKTVKEIQPKLMKMRQDSRKKMMTAMQENKLNPQRFQVIMRAVQSDKAVAKRFRSIAQETMNK